MALTTHSDRESVVSLKLRQSICKKILQQMPTSIPLGTVVYLGPNTSYESPDPPFPSNTGQNQIYHQMINPIVEATAALSATWLNLVTAVVVNSTWNGSSLSTPSWGTNPDSGQAQSFWQLNPPNWPGKYLVNGLPAPYLYATGDSLASDDAQSYGTYTNPIIRFNKVGALRYTINQFTTLQGAGGGGIIYPVKTIVGPTLGTTPLTYTDGNGNLWTIANGNGWICVPLPEFDETLVKVGKTFSSVIGGITYNNVSCQINPLAPNGRVNVLTLLPPV